MPEVRLARVRPRIVFTAVFAGLWMLLTGGALPSLLIGVPAVVAAAWATMRLRADDGQLMSLTGLMRFTPLFLFESVKSGIDVARRTLARRMQIAPGLTVYRHQLRSPAARVFFINCVSLLPGTLAADIEADQLTLHMLDSRIDPTNELQRLEQAVRKIYPSTEN